MIFLDIGIPILATFWCQPGAFFVASWVSFLSPAGWFFRRDSEHFLASAEWFFWRQPGDFFVDILVIFWSILSSIFLVFCIAWVSILAYILVSFWWSMWTFSVRFCTISGVDLSRFLGSIGVYFGVFLLHKSRYFSENLRWQFHIFCTKSVPIWCAFLGCVFTTIFRKNTCATKISIGWGAKVGHSAACIRVVCFFALYV